MSFVVFCRSSLLRVAFLEKISGRTFVFGCWCWFCVLGWVFAYVFASFLAVRSRKCLEKILLMSGLLFSGFVLSSFGFFVNAVFCGFFKRQRSGSNRTPLHTHLFCWFLVFCVPPLLSVSPVLAVRPASWWFSRGAILGPVRFWDSPWTF